MSEQEQQRAARYSDLFGSSHDHPSDCAYCPICATIAVVRETRPEVMEHLAAAAREFVMAAGLLLEEAGEILDRASSDASKPRDDGDGNVRHIDIK
jgi:hypothetical protein